jgi:phosphoribosylamine--glycine ligase
VLAVTAGGKDVGQARAAAYAGIARVSFNGAVFRRDIALRATARQSWLPIVR